MKPAALGVLCPSRFEYEALDRRTLRRRRVPVLATGMGKVRSVIGCHRLLKAYPRLERILLIGYTGALTDTLEVGDVVEPSAYIEQDYYAEPFEKFPNRIRREGPRLLGRASVDTLMLTQDRFLTENPHKKGPLARRHRRISCDMESYAVAAFCRAAGVGCSVVKIVSDRADAQADHDFLRACRRLAPKLDRTILSAVDTLLGAPAPPIRRGA